MASSSAAAAAASALSRVPALSSSTSPAVAQLHPNRHGRIQLPPPLKSKSSMSPPKIPSVDGSHASFVSKARLNEIVGGVSNDVSTVVSKSGKDAGEEEEPPFPTPEMSPEAIAEFMAQVSSLVKLVDSKDVVELQLKQPGCDLIIRKKEALPQPPAPAPVAMMAQPAPPAAIPSPYPVLPPAAPPAAHAAPSASPTSAPPAAKPPPPTPSYPPLKSPIAGTFYRSPAPGEPPYVKVGDKVKKGQIMCIIEAMKLMNEIEADHDGTVTDIMVENGKQVGLEQPLMVIEP